LVFVYGETLVLSSAVMTLEASAPSFAAGVGLWAASLALVGVSNTMPVWLRVVGFIAALLFAVVAVRIFMGAALTPLSEPSPFFAYPFLAATLVGRGCTIVVPPNRRLQPTSGAVIPRWFEAIVNAARG